MLAILAMADHNVGMLVFTLTWLKLGRDRFAITFGKRFRPSFSQVRVKTSIPKNGKPFLEMFDFSSCHFFTKQLRPKLVQNRLANVIAKKQ